MCLEQLSRLLFRVAKALSCTGELRIGDAVIMFADVTEQLESRPAGMFVYVENTDETYKKAIDGGATSLMKPTQQPYGYTCGFHDPFGNDWWPVEAEK